MASPDKTPPLNVHFSSARHDWRTPPRVFDDLHAEFDFTVDACSSDANALLSRHWTEADEPLLRSWLGERVFMNPPYGRQIARWMQKAWCEAPNAELIVALVPSRTDTAWWQDYAMTADEIRFIRGRLKFDGAENSAPFPSCLVIWVSTMSCERCFGHGLIGPPEDRYVCPCPAGQKVDGSVG